MDRSRLYPTCVSEQTSVKPASSFVCDACGSVTEGEPAGHGEFMLVRNGTLEIEHPPLCSGCALAIGVTAMIHLHDHEEDG